MTLCRDSRGLGSARVSRAWRWCPAIANFSCALHSRDVPNEMTLQIKEKFLAARRNQHAKRVRYPAEMSHRVS